MLLEWNTEEAIAANREDAWEEGREEGRGERNMEIARNALAKGIPLDVIHEITGIDIEAIRNIQAGL